MRYLAWITSFALLTLLLAGCKNSESGTSTPEDEAFQQQLAKAAEANKGAPTPPRGKSSLPPEVQKKVGTVPPPGTTTGK